MGRKCKLSPAQQQDVVDWWLSRLTVRQMARKMGVCDTTLYTVLIRRRLIAHKRVSHKDQVIRKHLKDKEKASLAGGRGEAVRPSNGAAGRQGMSTSRLYHGSIL